MKNKAQAILLVILFSYGSIASAQQKGNFFSLKLPVKKLQNIARAADRVVFTLVPVQVDDEDGYTLFGMAYNGITANERDTITLEAFETKSHHVGKAIQTGIFTLSKLKIDSLALGTVDPIILNPEDFPGTNKKFIRYAYKFNFLKKTKRGKRFVSENLALNPSPPAGGNGKRHSKVYPRLHKPMKSPL